VPAKRRLPTFGGSKRHRVLASVRAGGRARCIPLTKTLAECAKYGPRVPLSHRRFEDYREPGRLEIHFYFAAPRSITPMRSETGG
jgi:hypothetical protein